MKRIGYLLVLLAMLGMALSACGEAEPANHLEAIKQEGKLVVGTSADFPPFEYVDEAGNIVGFDIALAEAIGEKMGVEVEITDSDAYDLWARRRSEQRKVKSEK